MERCEVDDEKTMRNVLIGALKGNAREWFGSLTSIECNKKDYNSIEKVIQTRYGKTLMQKIRVFEAIQ